MIIKDKKGEVLSPEGNGIVSKTIKSALTEKEYSSLQKNIAAASSKISKQFILGEAYKTARERLARPYMAKGMNFSDAIIASQKELEGR